MSKNMLNDEQKEAYMDIIAELKANVKKDKTTKGSIGTMKKHLKRLGFDKAEVETSDGLYFS